jgi:hypothetical protein
VYGFQSGADTVCRRGRFFNLNSAVPHGVLPTGDISGDRIRSADAWDNGSVRKYSHSQMV